MSYDTGWICPACTEVAYPMAPVGIFPAAWPKQEWSHEDFSPLCPVVGSDSYVPAQPVRVEGEQ